MIANVSYGLQLIIFSVLAHQCITLMQDVKNREGEGRLWNLSILFTLFFCKPKTALKKKFYELKTKQNMH